jgi:hypothetical protein
MRRRAPKSAAERRLAIAARERPARDYLFGCGVIRRYGVSAL